MKKSIWIYALLALTILLTACSAGQPSKPVQIDNKALPEQAQPAGTAVEQIVTLVPEGGITSAPQPSPSPTSLALNEETLKTAADNVRALLGVMDLELKFNTLERSPNASNHIAILFFDSLGNRYYVNQDTLQPLEFTVEQPIQKTQGSSKTSDELRAVAQEIAKTHSKKWDALKDKLTYTEGNKGGENSFFRWEMPGTDVGGMPAILQIGLKQDGSLFAYINSLDFLP